MNLGFSLDWVWEYFVSCMRGSIKFFFSKGSSFSYLLLSWWGDQIPLKVGYMYHRPVSETQFKWRFSGVPMMAQHWWLGSFVVFQGIRTSIAKKPSILWFFRRWGPDPLPSPFWIRLCPEPNLECRSKSLLRQGARPGWSKSSLANMAHCRVWHDTVQICVDDKIWI